MTTKTIRRAYEFENPSAKAIRESVYGDDSIFYGRISSSTLTWRKYYKVYALVYDIPVPQVGALSTPTGARNEIQGDITEALYKVDSANKTIQPWIKQSLSDVTDYALSSFIGAEHLKHLRFDNRYFLHKELSVLETLVSERPDLPALHWGIYKIHYRDGGDRKHTQAIYNHIDRIAKAVYSFYPWLDITVPGATD